MLKSVFTTFIISLLFTIGLKAQDDPSSFGSTADSPSQITLNFTANAAGDDIMIAYNTTNNFGTPSGTYSVGDNISGGGTVIFNGPEGTGSYVHSSLSGNTTYYYKAWSVNSGSYSTGLTDNATTYKWEPTYHPTNFAAGTPTSSTIPLSWTDAVGTVLPDGYLIKASTVSYNDISDPVDGTAESESTLVKDVAYGTESVSFTSLSGNTNYYFKIYPYTNSGTHIDYKTDPVIPSVSATTDPTPAVITIADDGSISEGSENGEVITVTLSNDQFVTTLTPANWTLTNLPDGVSKGTITRVDATHASISLSGNRTKDYDSDITNLEVAIDGAELVTNSNGTSANSGVTFTATNDAESLSMSDDGSISEGAENGEVITVTLTGGTFATSLTPSNWSFSGLPSGVSIGSVSRTDATHVAITLSGNRTKDYDSDITNATLTIDPAEVDDYSGAAFSLSSGITFTATDDAESLSMSDDGSISEGAEDGEVITVTLTGGTFAASLNPSNWSFSGLPSGVSIGSVSRTDATHVAITLSGNRTKDYDSDITNATLTIDPAEVDDYSGAAFSLSSGVSFTATDDAESLSMSDDGSISEGAEDGEVITVTLTGGTFAATLTPSNWTLTNLPAGVSLGSLTRTSATTATITLSGNRTTDYESDITNMTLTVTASEIDDYSGADISINSGVTFTANNDPESISLAWGNPPGTNGTEATMDDEVLQITITGGTFNSANVNTTNITASGTATTDAGVSIESVSYVDANHVNVALAWDGTDYDADKTLTINVAGDAYDVGTTALTADITLTATLEPEVSISTSSLNNFGNVETGSYSAEQSFTVSGSNLSDNITITAPNGFEISTGTGASFSATNPITLTPSGGSVSSTTIYVRFSPSSTGAFDDNITVASSGVSTQNVSVRGYGTSSGSSGNVVITEVADYYGDATCDYIELYNAGDASVDLTNWTVTQRYTTGTSSYTLTLTSSIQRNTGGSDYMTLNPGEYAVIVYSGYSKLISDYNIGSNVAVFSNSVLPILNGDDRFQIESTAKAVIDNFGDWDDASTFSTTADKAYERNSYSADGTQQESWNISSSPSYGYTPGADNNNPLPVELLSFDLSQKENSVLLKWTTASEINSDYFDIEKSQDAINFQTIGRVTAAGNSNVLINYEFKDNDAKAGVFYYRLACYDYDGTKTYSGILSTKNGAQYFDAGTPYSNGNYLNIPLTSSSSSKIGIEIYDIKGSLIYATDKPVGKGKQSVRILRTDVDASGILIIKITNYKKVIIRKAFN